MNTNLELAEQLLSSADAYCHSIYTLITQTKNASLDTISLLASHSLELALKSFLLRHGSNENELSQLGHNLERTWGAASNAGLDVAVITPNWLKILASGHVFPFQYTQSKTLKSLDNQELYSNVKKVLRLIKEDKERSRVLAESSSQIYEIEN